MGQNQVAVVQVSTKAKLFGKNPSTSCIYLFKVSSDYDYFIEFAFSLHDSE